MLVSKMTTSEFYYRVHVIYFIIFTNMGRVIEGKLYSDYIHVAGK